MSYICSDCGRRSRLPDYCHGKPMSPQSQYTCPNCGRTSESPATCCGKRMVKS